MGANVNFIVEGATPATPVIEWLGQIIMEILNGFSSLSSRAVHDKTQKHVINDHLYRMVKEQVQQYLTKPNHCI